MTSRHEKEAADPREPTELAKNLRKMMEKVQKEVLVMSQSK
jgi:hypothetical protein